MKNTKFSFNRAWLVLTALLMSALVAVSFTSCKSDDDDDLPSGVEYLSSDSLLIGTWNGGTEQYPESYKISKNDFSNGYYEGNELCVRNISSSSGYIYIKYTRAYCSTHSDPTTYTYIYDTDAADVGKWYAIAFKDLTASSLSLSGAYGTVSSTSTLEEAISTFTIANGYFSTYSECVKQ